MANPMGEAADVNLVFTGGGITLDASTTVAAGGVATWGDVLVDLFGLDPDQEASGVVEINSTVPLAVGARSYASFDSGTLGQFLPGLTDEDGIGPGEAGIIPQLARTDQRYTNLGAVNLTDMPVTVAIVLRGEMGETSGDPLALDLGPREWKQLNDVLEGYGSGDAVSARIEVTTPGGRVWAYASIIDRLSRDPTTIPVQSR